MRLNLAISLPGFFQGITRSKYMKKDYTKYLAAAVGVVATTALVAGATYAYQGDSENSDKFRAPRFNTEQHEAMIEAIDNQDYNSWKELVGYNPITEKITEENFAKFVEARQLMKDGKYEEAKILREELGIQDMREGGCGFMGKGHKGNDEDHEDVIHAIENNDYEAWKTLMAGKPMADKITQENFNKMVEAHQLMQEGKFDEARQIQKDLEMGFGHSRGMGKMKTAQ